MKIINHIDIETSKLETLSRDMLKGYLRQTGEIIFKYTRKNLTYSGHCQFPHETYEKGHTYRIRVSIGRNITYPYIMNGEKNNYMPHYSILNQEEMIVAILGHETAHLKRHFKHKKNTETRVEKDALKTLIKHRNKPVQGEI
jgi:hypothetical protein